MKNKKLFVIKKYIYADSAKQAIQLEAKHEPDSCWIDEDWKKNNITDKKQETGFNNL